ncbi:MAG: hypothetical protein KIT14_21415 [bacterium]|nr:hypothetical protein [bacterium]
MDLPAAFLQSFNRMLSPDFLALIGLFAPVHQALVELFKLTGVKVRRYWEALLYIVYGSVYGAGEGPRWALLANKPIGTIPAGLSPELRRDWWDGPQRRLIESFVLRAVGDDPVSDVSDADVQNVTRIALMAAGPDCREVVEGLDQLIRSGARERGEISIGLEAFTPEDARIRETVARWLEMLGQVERVNPGLLQTWRDAFVEAFVPGVMRAERELANAIKAAEYRYHRQLHWASIAFAAVEAGLVTAMLRNAPLDGPPAAMPDTWSVSAMPVVFLAAFGLLLVAPRVSKSLTDSLVGLGARLRG